MEFSLLKRPAVLGCVLIASTHLAHATSSTDKDAYVADWIALHAAVNAADGSPGFRSRASGSRAESYEAYLKEVEQATPIIAQAKAAAASFAEKYGEGRAADTQGKTLLSRKEYSQTQRSNRLKAPSNLMATVSRGEKRFDTQVKRTAASALNRARNSLRLIKRSRENKLADHETNATRILDVIAKLAPNNDQVDVVRQKVKDQVAARRAEILAKAQNRLLKQANSRIGRMTAMEMDVAKKMHTESMALLDEALALGPNDEIQAVKAKWADYIETRQQKVGDLKQKRTAYLDAWLALAKAHAAVSGDKHGALSIIERLQRRAQSYNYNRIDKKVFEDEQAFVAGEKQVAAAEAALATFTTQYGDTPEARHAAYQASTKDELGHNRYYHGSDMLNALPYRSRKEPEFLVKELSSLRAGYNTTKEKMVTALMGRAQKFLNPERDNERTLDSAYQQASFSAVAAARYDGSNTTVQALLKQLNINGDVHDANLAISEMVKPVLVAKKKAMVEKVAGTRIEHSTKYTGSDSKAQIAQATLARYNAIPKKYLPKPSTRAVKAVVDGDWYGGERNVLDQITRYDLNVIVVTTNDEDAALDLAQARQCLISTELNAGVKPILPIKSVSDCRKWQYVKLSDHQ